MAAQRQPLNAQILGRQRGSVRRTVQLTTSVSTTSEAGRALIHDLSETGLRLETTSALEQGETLIVELPFVGVTEASVVWSKDNSYGCEFLTPVSKAAVSAALLKSRAMPGAPTSETKVEEVPIGVNPSLEEIAAWGVEFERTRGAVGFRLLGFRKSPEGLISAMVVRED
ncbi:MAG: PilZ domain-containing protein [Erythrobacter sp.]|uniref:PilZ domain-containing protein n=1 Tax=Erythrobacter sp. TaxID=1042 RepID=UPI0026111BEC|nr:PilZ domain-containing protein [Erythrobacter sp.]MDJ0978697.1 PilZ domain-containing protein [Erythrobacter sp.]